MQTKKILIRKMYTFYELKWNKNVDKNTNDKNVFSSQINSQHFKIRLDLIIFIFIDFLSYVLVSYILFKYFSFIFTIFI